jgi:hypothetical protein
VCDINVMHSLNTIAQHASGSHEYKINNWNKFNMRGEEPSMHLSSM